MAEQIMERTVDMTSLEIATDMADEASFTRVAARINWSTRPAADFARGVRLALAVGAHLFARNLASQGAKLYPDHEELQKMAFVLGPPRVVRETPSDPSVRANQAWLRDHADEYRGQWVAIRDGELLVVGETADRDQ